MYALKLILRNALRHRLRTTLTVLGLVVAVLSFGLLQTIGDAWYIGVNGASPNRLVARNAVSLNIPLPAHYAEKIRHLPGVRRVAAANWFGGIYREPKNFFPQFAVDPGYFDIYRDYRVPEPELQDYMRDRQGAIVGRKLADVYGFKVGDKVPLIGQIYPGTWTFTVRGIYDGATPSTDTHMFFFHWDYLNEAARQRMPGGGEKVGVFVVEIDDVDAAAQVSAEVDALFVNSLAETLTETERAFQIGFIKQMEAIVIAIRLVSYVVILIIFAVMANTMAMTARERMGEYATLKALGFPPRFVITLIYGESLAIACGGAALGIALTFPSARAFASVAGAMFPIFRVTEQTILLQAACAALVGVAAALVPAWRAARVNIVEGLRTLG